MADPTPSHLPVEKAVTGGTGNLFVGILLALILKSTLDAFFKDIVAYRSAADLADTMESHAASGLLNFFQLVVFVFTTIRFYWGTYRYNEEVPQSEQPPELALGLVAAVYLKPPCKMQKVWNCYKLFDVLTIAWLLTLIGAGHAWPNAKNACNWASLVGLTAICIWDVRQFWTYYTKTGEWAVIPPKEGA
jgi:hypothetical protein